MWTISVDVKLNGKWTSLGPALSHNQSTFQLGFGPSVGHHDFSIASGSEAAGLLKAIAVERIPSMRIQVGSTGQNGVAVKATFYHWVPNTSSDLYGTGRTVKIETADALAAMGQVSAIRPWKGQVSSIVSSIITLFEQKPVIESTHGNWDHIQSSSYLDFVSRLIEKAVNDSGNGGYMLFSRNDSIHFHTTSFRPTVHSLRGLEMTSWKSGFNRSISEGSGGIRNPGHEPQAGKAFQVESDASLSVKMAAQLPWMAGGTSVATRKIMPIAPGLGGLDELQARAQSQYDKVRLGLFQASFAVESLIVFPGDHVNLDMTQASQTTDPMSGLWLVLESRLVVKNGSLTSYCRVGRGEIQGLDVGKATGMSTASVNTSPGRMIVVKPIRSGIQPIPVESQ